MNLKNNLRNGLITLGLLVYLDLLGIPLTAPNSAITIFIMVTGLFSFILIRRKAKEEETTLPNALLGGLIIGLIAALGISLLTLTFANYQADGVRVNTVFAQVLPEHTGTLTGLTKEEVLDGADPMPGILQLALSMLAAGVVGGGLTLVSTEKLKQNIQSDAGQRAQKWTVLFLPIFFFLFFMALKLDAVQIGGSEENVFGLVLIYLFMGSSLYALRQDIPKGQRTGLAILLALLMLYLPVAADLFQNAVLGYVFIFIIMGIGLNIVVGYAGLLDLGYVGFFAVGAYGYALLSAPQSWFILNIPGLEPINFWTGILVAIGIGILTGIILGVPVLRMRGDYLAIVTLGFGEIIRLLLLNLRDFTGGPGGVLNIPPPVLFGLDLGNPRDILYLGMFFAVVVTIITVRLRDSRLGRAWIAMREDEDVAQAMGINLVSTKLLAFAGGAALAAIGGGLYAARQVNIFPDNFALDVSINVLSLIIIGGIGSIDGVVLGAIALIGLPEILRSVDEYRIVAFGALLVAMMILRPEGLLPSERRKRELHSEEPAGVD